MLSSADLESLITAKRLAIEKEKCYLGLSPPIDRVQDAVEETREPEKQVRIVDLENEGKEEAKSYKLEDHLPAGLNRYIRRYLGIPVMLKAGEYSPNNPLVRGERTSGDVLLGLGEYERRRHTLKRLRQEQYREYLDQQAKVKQEAKERAERERLEREERERLREEELRKRDEERERVRSPEQRRASVCYGDSESRNAFRTIDKISSSQASHKVDTAVQVGTTRPLSVAVQTEDCLFTLESPSPRVVTQAERELSPRTVQGGGEGDTVDVRRRSYGDFDARPAPAPRPRARLSLRSSYTPSIFDADAIHLRNVQAEKEAAERRQCYQQELRSQIREQRRLQEERRARETLLEAAETRRLEQQLRALRTEDGVRRHEELDNRMKEHTSEFEKKRISLQKEIDKEKQNLFRASTHPTHSITKRNTIQNDDSVIYLKKPPYSTNIPENSIFNPNYDVESYLRRNLNPTKEILMSHRLDTISSKSEDIDNIDIEKRSNDKPKYEPSFYKKDLVDETPIPVLKHSPKISRNEDDNSSLSEGMKLVEDKWKVPAVQKNILKTLPNNEGKNVSILTQLGSIRRQLQLEQLRLDMTKN